MFSKLKALGLAAVMTVALPVAAFASTIQGQIDISGTVNLGTSTFSASGNVDFNNPGFVIFADGDFDTTTNVGDLAALTDINFSSPGTIWSVGGFSFVATAFDGIMDTTQKAFHALGTIFGNGYDPTKGTMTFSSQVNNPNQVTASFSSTTTPVPVPAAGLLLLTAIGGAAALRRRKKVATA